MRRFEFSDGKSHKFWQVECNGTTMRVSFGRIGSAGQTQEKTFATAEKAQAEADKLIREKTGKGYRETSGASAPATPPAAAPSTASTAKPKAPPAPAPTKPPPPPPPAPTPAPAAAAPSPGELIALRAAAPIRGRTEPKAKPDVADLYARLRAGMAAAGDALDAGARERAALRALMSAARAAFASETPPAKLDRAAQTAAFALIGRPLDYHTDGLADEFIAYWCALHGDVFALDTLAASDLLTVRHARGGTPQLLLVDADGDDEFVWRDDEAHGWRAVRALAAFATPTQHTKLCAHAETLARQGSARLRATLAAGFERAEWSAADDPITGARRDSVAGWFWPLLVAAPDFAAARAMLDRTGLAPTSWQVVHELVDLRVDFVARYGASAVPLFVEALGAATSVDSLRALADALALLETPEVVAWFVDALARSELRAVAAQYLHDHPGASVVALAERAASKSAAAEIAQTALRPILAALGARADALLAAASPAARALLAKFDAANATAIAESSAVPEILRNPPWASGRRAARAAALELTPIATAERVVERIEGKTPGEEADDLAELRASAARDRERWGHSRGDDPKDIVARLRAASVRPNESRWQRESANQLTRISSKHRLALLPDLVPEALSWYFGPTLLTILAEDGTAALDFVLRTIDANCVSVESAFEVLAHVDSPRVAPRMADAYARLKKVKAAAADWLLRFADTAAMALLPPALGKPGKPRDAAAAALRMLASRGARDVLARAAARYGEHAERGLDGVLAFDPLLEYPARLPALPAFFSAGALSRPVLRDSGQALPDGAVETLATMLAISTLAAPYAGLAPVQAACTPESLAAFAWDLFQTWLTAGAPSKEQWAFCALGHLGDDECARRLAPFVRAWPGEAAHARAVLGLDVLARIGTDVALMHLHGIAQKVKFKGLQEKAREKIDQIAQARGLTSQELADRLVPDLGLDDDGSLTLDLGPRQFRVGFDESLKPYVSDDTGKRLPDLPKAKQSDDPARAEAAHATWKALKKDAKTVASTQVVRLELAMCAQRRWPAAIFRQFLLEHPLLIHLVRRLLWGCYDASGKLSTGFRVAEDRSLADGEDREFTLRDDAEVGLVHRLDLSDAQAAAWGQIFADYEVLQPFEQISRQVFTPQGSERTDRKLTRVEGADVPTGKVLGLDQRGWRRGAPQDAGIVTWYEKALPDDLVANLELDPGIFTGAIAEAPQQKLGAVTLSRGSRRWDEQGGEPFGSLSAVAFSELVRDLEALRS